MTDESGEFDARREYYKNLGEALAAVLFEEAKREERRWLERLRKKGVIASSGGKVDDAATPRVGINRQVPVTQQP